jgi:PAS domain S-box-containing protein
MVGRLINEVFDMDKFHVILSKYYECVSSGIAQKFVDDTQKERGEKFVYYTILPIKDDNGKVVELLGIGEDITPQKKAENKLIESEEKYRILFERSPLPKLIFEKETLRILEVNLAAINLYGYSRKEFQRMSLFDIRPSERFDDLRKFFGGGVPQSYVFDTVHNRKNGGLMTVNITANHIRYENKDARMIVVLDRTEQEKAKDELVATTQNLRELAAHLQNIREEERLNIAREIHDELGQQLTGLKMDISWLGKKLCTENESIRNKVNSSLELIDITIHTVRKLATKLRPGILDDLGLAEAIKWHSSEFSKRTGVVIAFCTDVADSNLSPAISIALFRIYQESLTNVARHANATAVCSSLKIDGTNIVLTVADNGTGFNTSQQTKRKTLGLLGMKERVTMFNGKYSIESTPGKGTQVVVQIPMAN